MKLQVLAAFTFLSAFGTTARAQVLETETARSARAGTWKIGMSYEHQLSKEGAEAALPFAIEYSPTDRLELLVEPVPYVSIRPRRSLHARGAGDTEATLLYRVSPETHRWPALAVAGEVKFATARNTLIGTGKTDYAGYLIASKRFGRLDTHANVGYTVVGQPAGVTLQNLFSFAVAGVYRPGARSIVFAEVLGNTTGGEGTETGGGADVIPEAAGGELVGTLGAGRALGRGVLAYFGLSYDNSGAVLLHPGFTFTFR